MNFDAQLAADIHRIDEALQMYIKTDNMPEKDKIMQAVKYSAFASGKRLRPVLTLEFCRACGEDVALALPFAAALEMIHTYSLIHDDLPCMDDDDLRRGKPTNHKVFGEAFAVLAGDCLLNRAFETVLNPQFYRTVSADIVLRAAYILAQSSGVDGMLGGQVLDILSEGLQLKISELERLQALKTGALIDAAAHLGCVIGGASDEQTRAARKYASCIGLAFQIQDDILDVEGDTDILGKKTGSDVQNDKCTFPSVLGLQRSHDLVQKLTQEAIAALSVFNENNFLLTFAERLAIRSH